MEDATIDSLNALVALLIERGVFTAQDWERQLGIEAEHLNRAYEKRFPGFEATDMGMAIDPARGRETMRGWKP